MTGGGTRERQAKKTAEQDTFSTCNSGFRAIEHWWRRRCSVIGTVRKAGTARLGVFVLIIGACEKVEYRNASLNCLLLLLRKLQRGAQGGGRASSGEAPKIGSANC